MEVNPGMNIDLVVSSESNTKKGKKKVENDNIIETNDSFNLVVAIPDCFVFSLLKLSNGKNGHGERRLYTGDSNNNNEYISKKPWRIEFPSNYKSDIEDFLDNPKHFSKSCDDRKNIVYNSIDSCNKKTIHISTQNGNEDVKRYYIGPNKNDKQNIKLYDTLRYCIIPKIYSLNLIEKEEYFECNIIKNEFIDKKKQKKASNVSLEWLTYLAKTLDIEIQHEHNKGEFQLRNPINGYFWPVDGYHNCESHRCSGSLENPCEYNKYIWEFQGDYFHGNPSIYNKDDTFHGNSYSKKHNKDSDKKTFYEKSGHIVITKWESDWVKDKKLMKKNKVEWV